MAKREKLEAQRAAKRQEQLDARAAEKALTLQIKKEDLKAARQRHTRIGKLADDAGLTAVSLDTFQQLFTLLATHGTTSEDLQAWLELAAWAVPVEKE